MNIRLFVSEFILSHILSKPTDLDNKDSFRNSRFKNLHHNKRCFILGNGSSLKKQNITSLKNEITFVMNAFWKHPIISPHWQPTYYCFADPITFDGEDVWVDFFSSLKRKIKKSIFFVPFFGKATIDKQKLLPVEKTYYVRFEEAKNDKQVIDLTNYIPPAQSTSQLAIEIAIYMGCSPIYLLGLDHDWLSHRGIDRHFYRGKTIKSHPKVSNDLSQATYKSELEACLRLWNRYEYLKELATRQGIKILNATDGGFLDVFPRVRFEKIPKNKI